MKKLNNLSYGILNTIQNAIFPLVTLPYVLQTLGPELYGENLHAVIFHQLFSFLFILAINPYALRLFSHAMADGKIIEECVFNRVVSFQFIMSSVATVLQLTIISVLNLLSPLYLLYTVITFFTFMNVEWLFQARQNYKTIFFRTFFIRLLVLCSLFFFIKGNDDFYKYSMIMAFNLILPAIVTFILARRFYCLKFSFKDVKNDFFDAKYFYVNGAIGSIYSYLDQVVIGLLVSSKELTILNLIKTLASTIMSVPNLVNRFIMPDALSAFKSDKLFSHHKKYFTLMLLCLTIGLSVIYFFGLSVITMLFGSKVDFNQFYLLLISVSVFFTSISVYIDTQSSIVLCLEKITTTSNIMVTIVSVIMAITLFDEFSYLSPFIGFIIGEFSGVMTMVLLHLFVFKTNFTRRRML